MLRENPQVRPNIYQVLREVCAMQGREPPVRDVSDRKLPSVRDNTWLMLELDLLGEFADRPRAT
jgi:AP2-associated kinase